MCRHAPKLRATLSHRRRPVPGSDLTVALPFPPMGTRARDFIRPLKKSHSNPCRRLKPALEIKKNDLDASLKASLYLNQPSQRLFQRLLYTELTRI